MQAVFVPVLQFEGPDRYSLQDAAAVPHVQLASRQVDCFNAK